MEEKKMKTMTAYIAELEDQISRITGAKVTLKANTDGDNYTFSATWTRKERAVVKRMLDELTESKDGWATEQDTPTVREQLRVLMQRLEDAEIELRTFMEHRDPDDELGTIDYAYRCQQQYLLDELQNLRSRRFKLDAEIAEHEGKIAALDRCRDLAMAAMDASIMDPDWSPRRPKTAVTTPDSRLMANGENEEADG